MVESIDKVQPEYIHYVPAHCCCPYFQIVHQMTKVRANAYVLSCRSCLHVNSLVFLFYSDVFAMCCTKAVHSLMDVFLRTSSTVDISQYTDLNVLMGCCCRFATAQRLASDLARSIRLLRRHVCYLHSGITIMSDVHGVFTNGVCLLFGRIFW